MFYMKIKDAPTDRTGTSAAGSPHDRPILTSHLHSHPLVNISSAWTFFTVSGDTYFAICNTCRAIVNNRETTTGLD